MSHAVSFGSALRFWLKLGFISFGGPAGQIAIMHEELVERRRWISEARFLHALNYCMLLPGPEAQQLATYIGWLLHRTRGGLAAGLLFILPSLLILIALSFVYVAFGSLPAVAAFFSGIKPAVVAIVALAAWRIGGRVIHGVVLAAIALAAFLALSVFAVPFPWIVLGAALLGWLGAKRWPAQFAPAARAAAHGPATALDDSQPAHAVPSWRGLVRVAAIGVALWLGAMALLVKLQGAHGTLPQMGGFFSKAALVTFGGAYAVLPYVNQGAVEQYGWLTTSQMIDGLALGETTPGPLIMVVTFVGYVGSWTHAAAQGLAPPLAGLAGALVVTFFTFLPSFVFIFAGAPLIEATRGRQVLAAPLTAVTAAVVGVIANLALFFAMHVFWPAGLHVAPDYAAVLIAAGAAIALFYFRVGVIPVILAAGATGVALRLMTG